MRDVEFQLQNLPKGKFICSKNGTTYKWYYSRNGKKVYIPKSNRVLAEKFALQKYLTLLRDDLKVEQAALQGYLNRYSTKERKSDALLKKCPEHSRLLAANFQPKSEELSQWANCSYEKNMNYTENLIHTSVSGHMLRSKSESMIDSCLYFNKIPFRYEEVLHLGATTFYPDFTIRHPRTGEYVYWEHFGMMDDPCYARKTSSKLATYIENGIIPSINLITTFETKKKPLTYEAISKIVEYHFL